MKKLLYAFVLLLCLYGLSWASDNSFVPAKELINEIGQNQLRFDKNYKEKVITTEGFVGTIEILDGKYVVKLFEEKEIANPFRHIECTFEKSQESALLELNKNDTISVKGKYKGKQVFQSGALVLFQCEITVHTRGISEADNREASNIIANLRSMKSAALMFYADNMDKVDSVKLKDEINSPGSANKFFSRYIGRPLGSEYIFAIGWAKGKYRWFVGCDLSQKPEDIKKIFRSHTQRLELLDEKLQTYSGGNFIFMLAK